MKALCPQGPWEVTAIKTKSIACLICRNPFDPRSNVGKRQKVCAAKACQQERKRRAWRRWAAGHLKQKRDKLKLWAKAYPNYWRVYRKNHPAYAAKDSKRRCLAIKRARRSAKQTQWKALRAERIGVLQHLAQQAQCSAKQTQYAPVILGVVNYLCWRDGSAKQTQMDTAGAPGG